MIDVHYRSEEDNGNVIHEATPEARRMFRNARVFTTGMIAKVCRVAPRTAANWIDSGKLAGYRLPGCKDRRVPRAQLVRFMLAHGLPLDVIGGEALSCVVLAGCGGPWAEAFAAALGSGWATVRASCLFDAAIAVAQGCPEAVVFGCSLGQSDCRIAAGRVRQTLPDAVLIGLLADDAPGDAAGTAYDLAVRESDDPARAAAFLLERSAA